MNQNKHSLWIVPGGEAGQKLQQLINKLAAQHNASAFVPHMTVVANIYTTDDEQLADVQRKVGAMAAKLQPFDLTLSKYGYLDEEYRCLFLLADAPELGALYQAAAEQFPQVDSEHFAAMPHLSVLYGLFDTAAKQKIITENPILPLTFKVSPLDLYLTNNPVSSWRKVASVPLQG